MSVSIFKDFTNRYALSKTLRFELKPVGKTRTNIEKANPNFIYDQEIEVAYQILKPVFDKLHEEFITKSLENEAAKNLNVNEYFELYQKLRAEQDKDKKRTIEKDIEKEEGKLRNFFGVIYEKSGEQFKACAVDQNAKNILDAKLANVANDKEKKKIEKEIKKLEFLKEKSFKVLTEAGILKYIKSRIDDFVVMKLKTRDGKLVGKEDLEKALGTAHSKGVFERFFTYLNGFNTNRENYYSIEEKATAVANRAIGENLPKFSDNVIEFEKKKDKYSGIYNFLEGKNIELKGKSQDGQDIDLEPITKDIYTIRYFVNCLSQPEIEKYNLLIGNANNLINRYNQQQADKKDKLRIFKTLYKQIGCGEKGEFIPAIKSDDELKEILKDVANKGDKYFGNFNTGIADKIDTIGEFCAWIKDNTESDGVFWNEKAINTISSKYFTNWFVLKKALKDNGVFTGKKKDEEDIKIPQAVELRELFAVLDTTVDWQVKGVLFKESLFDDDRKKKAIDDASKPSEAMLGMIFLDVKGMAEDFANLKDEVLKITTDFQKQENIQKIKQFLDNVLYVNQIVKYWKVKDKFAVNSTLAEAIKMILFSENNPIPAYDIVRNYLTRKPQEELNKLKLNFENALLAAGWDLNKQKDNSCVILKDKEGNKYLAIMDYKDTKIFEKTPSNLLFKADDFSWTKMEYKYFPDASKMIPKCSTQLKKVKQHFSKSDDDFTIKKGDKTAVDKFIDDLVITKEIWELNNRGYNKDDLTNTKILDKEDKNYVKAFQKKFSEKDSKKYKKSLIEWIDFCKKFLKVYPSTSIFAYQFKDSMEYHSVDEFYTDVDIKSYEVNFNSVSKRAVDSLVEQGKIYLFKIGNKDNNLKNGKSKTSGQNLHTIYWNAVFNNIENKPKLNGEAEIFYRPVVQNLVKDKDKNGKMIGASKKRFEQEKFIFHCPITLNFGAKSSKLNDEINKVMAKNRDKVCFIGIDRGEKHLAYYSLIDGSGKILEQGSFNEINGQNYAVKLEEKADNRDDARKNWKTIGTIKELKNGYISQLVRKIVDLAVKYSAYIILEDLNIGFKRGRQKIEKSVYQKLELALAKKLNFLVDKKAKNGEVMSVQEALQLTPPVTNFQDIGKQCGIMLYTRANYTSQTDPVTGWRKTIYFTKTKQDDLKAEICEKFDEIGFDGRDYYFEYKDENTDKTWRIWSGKDGKSLDRYRGKRNEHNGWKIEKKDIVELLNKVFYTTSAQIKCVIKKAKKDKKGNIIENANISFNGKEVEQINDLKYAIELIQQIRNTASDENGNKVADDDKNADFILSPVRDKDGNHFDSRLASDQKPNSGDANGAFNIARKGIIMFEHIRLGYGLFISDAEWDAWLAGEEVWEKWIKEHEKDLLQRKTK